MQTVDLRTKQEKEISEQCQRNIEALLIRQDGHINWDYDFYIGKVYYRLMEVENKNTIHGQIWRDGSIIFERRNKNVNI